MATNKDEPDHLERVLCAMTSAEDIKELTMHMSTKAIDYFAELAKGLSEDELRRRATDGSLLAEAKELSQARFDEDMRRWLIAHGYI